jgi:hypothetical protein
VATHEELYGTTTIRTAAASRALPAGIALIEAFAAAGAVWRPAAILIAVGIVGTIASHLVVGVAGYRRAMRSAWPKVRPLRDDGWD